MTQSGGGNGHEPDVNPDDITVYEPVFTPGPGEETEPIAWWQTALDAEDGELIPDLPPELDEPEEPPTSN